MERTIEEEVAFASDPGRWPHSFMLPLVRRGRGWISQYGQPPAGKQGGDVGFLVQPSMADPTPPPEPVVYVGNIMSATPYAEMPQERYEDLWALLAEWRID